MQSYLFEPLKRATRVVGERSFARADTRALEALIRYLLIEFLRENAQVGLRNAAQEVIRVNFYLNVVHCGAEGRPLEDWGSVEGGRRWGHERASPFGSSRTKGLSEATE